MAVTAFPFYFQLLSHLGILLIAGSICIISFFTIRYYVLYLSMHFACDSLVFAYLFFVAEGQRPVRLIPHLHCWLALILIYSTSSDRLSQFTPYSLQPGYYIQKGLNQLPPNNQRIN